MVADTVREASEILRRSGIETPQLDAEILLALLLNCTRLDVIAHPERELTEAEARHFDELVEKRAHRYPLAYLVGWREFYGLDIAVAEDVLVPRPETEVLVEETVLRVPDGSVHIAEIGVGSGAVAVALAANLPDAVVYGTDISATALEVAALNTANHNLAGRIRLFEGDLVQPLAGLGIEFDAVVSNPPYIPTADIPGLQPEVSRWEPREALDGGRDGLDVIRRLLPECIGLLRPTGFAAIEVGMGQAGAVAEIAGSAGYSRVERVRDLSGIERVVICSR